MTFQKVSIVFVVFLTWPAHSLKCFHNFCVTGYNGRAAVCISNGHGVHTECGTPGSGFEAACYEEPINKESGQMKFKGCTIIKKYGNTIGTSGCSDSQAESAQGFTSYGCLCFEDFCNNRFNNTQKSVFLVRKGHLARKKDGNLIELMTTDSEETFNQI